MKKSFALHGITLVLIAITSVSEPAYAQGPPPPPSGGHGQTTNQQPTGGSAPIGSGLAILLTLGAGYGVARSVWRMEKEK